MLFKQQGSRVFRAKGLGILFVVFILTCLLLYLAGFILSIRDGNELSVLIFPTAMYLLFISAFTITAIFNIWMFPDIELGADGIVLNTFFYKRKIAWNEIESVGRKRQEIHIVLSRDGLPLNRFYGFLYTKTWDKPIVIFTSNQENLNKFENEINSYLPNTP